MTETSVSAPCPVCNEPFPLESMNKHIDLCLLSSSEREGKQLSPPMAASSGQERKDPSPGSRKRTSPAAASQKQSVLGFGKKDSQPPPAKSRKLAHEQSPSSAATLHASSTISSTSRTEMARTLDDPPLRNATPDLSAPLAEVVRPTTIEEYVGQEGVTGKNAILRTILESGQVPSLIFWGPPGCGKTTLARIIARVARGKQGTRFTQLSATSSGVSDVKEAVKVAKNERIMFKRKTILFIDEIHRFNKLQQDTFLPHIEDGTITLLGATTENPSFQLNSALLSRCRVIVLEKLQSEEIEGLLRRALPKIGATEKTGDCMGSQVLVDPEAIATLAHFCDGDARSALNGLQIAVQAKRTRFLQEPTSESHSTTQTTVKEDVAIYTSKDGTSTPPSSNGAFQCPTVTVDDAKESLQRTHLLYDRAGEEHYNCISALIKSMRGSCANGSLYWLTRMLSAGEDPLYVARRVVVFASEDIGLADPNALGQAVAAFQACQFIGMPACEVNLAQAVVYMARAPKSIEIYDAYGKAKTSVKRHQGPLPSVPLHLRNAPTKLMKELGYGKGYKYNPAYSEPVEQQYMPDGMEDIDFFSSNT